MKREELFNKTIGILVNAYHNDELEPGSPCGCAVGNLVAAGCGYTINGGTFVTGQFKNGPMAEWVMPVVAGAGRGIGYIHMNQEARKQVDSTGYSVQELSLIEHAFECRDLDHEELDKYRSKPKDERSLEGLFRVYDMLCDIHEVDKTKVKVAEEVFA